jgi:hypothetical protein
MNKYPTSTLFACRVLEDRNRPGRVRDALVEKRLRTKIEMSNQLKMMMMMMMMMIRLLLLLLMMMMMIYWMESTLK